MLDTLMSHADALVSSVQTALFSAVVQPLMYRFGWMDYDEETYDALYWLIVAFLEIVGMYLVLRPLEALRPVEKWDDRRAVRTDVIYTWINRLGIVNVVFFFCLQPVFDALHGWLRMHNIGSFELEHVWPSLSRHPLLSFALYLIILDLAGYWYHRWQHRFAWWWELHAVHHSQHQLSMWSDDRNHLLDVFLQASFFALIAVAIGVPPGQYVVLLALSQVAQSVQHVNARLPYGPLLARLMVSPTFHRRHHAIGYGHEGRARGCNFGVLLPWWDVLFGTANWSLGALPTGIRDQFDASGQPARNYGEGFWAQQTLALLHSAKHAAQASRRVWMRLRPGSASAVNVTGDASGGRPR